MSLPEEYSDHRAQRVQFHGVRHVETTNSSSITNSSGQLLLTGIARTLRGTLPVIRVSALRTYSLIGNVTAKTPSPRRPWSLDGQRLQTPGQSSNVKLHYIYRKRSFHVVGASFAVFS